MFFMIGGFFWGGKLLVNVFGGFYNDYVGYVFWDMDMWIMLLIMMFYLDMVRIMIGFRFCVFLVVKVRVKVSGYEGV